MPIKSILRYVAFATYASRKPISASAARHAHFCSHCRELGFAGFAAKLQMPLGPSEGPRKTSLPTTICLLIAIWT